jgi:hypothetical protein
MSGARWCRTGPRPARERWGRSLTEERDRRVAAQASPDATPRTRQAVRGHVTRELMATLAPIVEPQRARQAAHGDRTRAGSGPRQGRRRR